MILNAAIWILYNLTDLFIRISLMHILVKAASNSGSRSLMEYIGQFQPAVSIRISSKNFGFATGIKSVPLYAVHLI
jgi:hypothetical protein